MSSQQQQPVRREVNEAWLSLRRSLDHWHHLGTQQLPDGTEMIGHTPHVAPEAWLHILFAPLSKEQIDQLEASLGAMLPNDCRSFFRFSNGVQLFGGALALYGLRTDFTRQVHVRQPFSIIAPNQHERPKDLPASMVILGGYGYDGSRLCGSNSDKKIVRIARSGGQILNEWPQLDSMLLSEVRRLGALFDTHGRRLDANAPTIPPSATA